MILRVLLGQTFFVLVQLLCIQGVALISGTWFPTPPTIRQLSLHDYMADAERTSDDFPYMASLHIGDIYRCGAVIIKKNLLLTAAHCVAKQDKSRIKIIVGGYYARNVDSHEQHLTVMDIMIHPLFDNTTQLHDIATILVQGMVMIPNIVWGIQPAYNNSGNFTGRVGVASGWGVIKDPKPMVWHLQAHLTIKSNEECRRNLVNPSVISETNLCAGSHHIISNGSYVGGPIVIKNYLIRDERKDLLVGIISFRGVSEQFLTVSTDISKYSKWICCAELMTKDKDNHSQKLTSMFNKLGECNCTGFVYSNFKWLGNETERIDGVNHYQDGERSNELHCKNQSNGDFRCGDGTCVNEARISDCLPDSSDRLGTAETSGGTLFSSPQPITAQNLYEMLANYITGGVHTTLGDFPYMASLQIDDSHRCGAVIIRKNLLLTAAHCVAKTDKGRIKILAGAYHLDFVNRNEQHLSVKEIMIHPLYNDSGIAQPHDIAAILVHGMKFVPNIVEGIEWAYDDIGNLTGNLGLASGWGITTNKGSTSLRPSPVLLQANLTIMSNEECQNLIDPSKISETHFCAGSLHGNMSTCKGDSGGPIVLKNYFYEGDCWNFLIGIISFGGPCGQSPTVSTDVRKYSQWIDCSELMIKDENNHPEKLTNMFNKLGECNCTGFVCNNFKCLTNQTERCDGVDHCQDGARSDELHCKNCSNGAFRCDNGTCIEGLKRCDCVPNCLDGKDELGCETPFRCGNGKCIDNGLKCDTTNDCGDGSDEQECDSAERRDRFVDLRPQTGLRFQGNGYAIIDGMRMFQFREKSFVRLSFQTRSPNGLLFLVGRGKRFLSVELVNGTVVFQYDLGSGPARIATPEPYNDGRWHKVDAVRVGRYSRLDVDSNMRGRGESPGSQENLTVSDYMYFGGYPGRHDYPEVSQKGFEGCLDNVNVDDKPVDLTQAKEARYTLVGCPTPQFEQIVATFGGSGYLKIAGDNTSTGPLISDRDEVFELNFRFRSNDTHGLVFYGANDNQSNFLSLSLAEGLLYVKTEPGSAQVSTNSLNDAQWHMVTVTRDRNKLLVIVDNASEYSENAGNGPLYLSSAGSQLFFGGRPDDYRMRTDAAVVDVAFNGCLGDISINGKRLDFKDAKVKDSIIGQKCLTGVFHEAEDISVSHRPPTIPVEEDSESIDESEISRGIPRPTTTTTTTPGIFDEDDFDYSKEIETTSAPTRKPKLMKPTPIPFMECALPYREVPTEEEDVSIEDGVRFGNYEKTSRLEFQTSEGDKSRSEYSIEFKTNSPDGLLFFRSDFVKPDYVALFMKRGILHFAFDSGYGPAILNSTKQLNDSMWHTASFSRHQFQGSLTIDGQIVSIENSPGSTMDINAGPTVYIGGLPPDAWAKKLTSKKLLNIDSAFRGCLRNFLVENKSPGVPSVRHSVEPCTEDVEPGFFFYPNGGYLRLGKTFKVGQNIKISLSIRPRHPSGLIMSIHGTRDYVVLQMVNGTVNFTVDNGHGSFSSSFSKGLYDLCDGKWHTILAIKIKNLATLSIDGQHAQVGMGRLRSSVTDTNHPVYLGGQPTPGAPGVETNEQFVGCIKDFIIHGRPAFKFSYDSIVEGKVALHSCPADGHKSR